GARCREERFSGQLAKSLRLELRALILTVHHAMHPAARTLFVLAEPVVAPPMTAALAVASVTVALAPAVTAATLVAGVHMVMMRPQHVRKLGETALLGVVEALIERSAGVGDTF